MSLPYRIIFNWSTRPGWRTTCWQKPMKHKIRTDSENTFLVFCQGSNQTCRMAMIMVFWCLLRSGRVLIVKLRELLWTFIRSRTRCISYWSNLAFWNDINIAEIWSLLWYCCWQIRFESSAQRILYIFKTLLQNMKEERLQYIPHEAITWCSSND